MDKQDNTTYLQESLQPQYFAGSIICIILVIAFVVLRFIAQRSIGKANELDNWVILVAAVCPSIICCGSQLTILRRL